MVRGNSSFEKVKLLDMIGVKGTVASLNFPNFRYVKAEFWKRLGHVTLNVVASACALIGLELAWMVDELLYHHAKRTGRYIDFAL